MKSLWREEVSTLLLIMFVAYAGGYAYCRSSRIIVHHVAWEFDPIGARLLQAPVVHSIYIGDDHTFRPSFRYSPGAAAAWWLFKPAMSLEAESWNLMKPSVTASDVVFYARRYPRSHW